MFSRKERIFYYSLLFVCLIPLLKIIFHMLTGSYQIVTIMTYPALLLIDYTLITRERITVINNKYLWLVAYILVLALCDVILGESEIISALSSSLRFLYIIFGVSFVIRDDVSDETVRKIFKVSFLFFCVTTVICFIQAFAWMPLHNVFRSYGGNFISATVLGNSRVNGGIGGTVIGYSSYIVVNAVVLLCGEKYYSKWEKIVFSIAIVVSTMMNYSRATFVGLFILLSGYMLFYKLKTSRALYKILLVGSVAAFAFWFSTTSNQFVRYIFVNDTYRQMSDSTRINSTINALQKLDTPIKWLFGLSVGQNTGFTTAGKLQTDGALFSIIIDYGFLGALLFLLFFINLFIEIKKSNQENKKGLFIATVCLTIAVLIAINSGFLENVNMLYFPFLMLCLKSFCLKTSVYHKDGREYGRAEI